MLELATKPDMMIRTKHIRKPVIDPDEKMRVRLIVRQFKHQLELYKQRGSYFLNKPFDTNRVQVVIPISTEMNIKEHDRIPITLQTFKVLAEQQKDPAFGITIKRVVLSDHGLSHGDKVRLIQMVKALDLDVKILRIPMHLDRHKMPAHSRNLAFQRIVKEGLHEPVVLIDSDSVPSPNMLKVLCQEIRSGAIAAGPKVLRIAPYLGLIKNVKDTMAKYNPENFKFDVTNFIKDGFFDVATMTALGNNAFPSANGLMLSPAIVELLTLEGKGVFLPSWTAEDNLLILSLALSGLGKVLRTGECLIYDQARKVQGDANCGVFRQQYRWSADHSEVWGILAKLGLVPKGLSVLYPTKDGSLASYRLPHPITGCLVNPKEWVQIRDAIHQGKIDLSILDAAKQTELAASMRLLKTILWYIDIFEAMVDKQSINVPFRILKNGGDDHAIHRWRDPVSLLARTIGGYAGSKRTSRCLKQNSFFFCQRQSAQIVK